jgi:hypothetical protein
MRLPLAIAVAAVLVLPAGASEWASLHTRLRDMEPMDHVGAMAAWRLYDCTMDAARKLGAKPEPTIHGADWMPASARPTPEQEAASAMSECAEIEAKAAGVLPAPELVAIKASVLAIAVETIRWTREERGRFRRE